MRRVSTACIALLLIACAPAESGAASGGGAEKAEAADPAAMPPGADFAASPAAEPAAPVQPVSNTASAITGEATFAPEAYSFAFGQRYTVEPAQKVSASVKWSAKGGPWADLLGVDKGGEIELVRVTGQAIDPAKARNGSLCGKGQVRWIAVGRSAEDVGAEVVMAAFSGAQPPGPTGRDEDLCGTFSYAAGN